MQAQDKSTRQQKLLSLIRTERLSTQGQLVKALEKAGFQATQSSVSRDLEELGIFKVQGIYTVPNTSEKPQIGGLRSLKTSGNSLIVALCESGWASAVSSAIDKANIPDIVGTIAGDDTIFIAVTDKSAQKNVMKEILAIFTEV